LKAACCAALAVVMFRANLLVVVFTFYAATSGIYMVCFGYQHTKQNRGFSGAFSRLWQQLFYDLVLFLVHFSPARICTRVFCTAKLFVAPEGLIFAAKLDFHLHCQVMKTSTVKH